MAASTQRELNMDLLFGPSGDARMVLAGCLNAQNASVSWNRLEQEPRVAGLEKLEVDATKLGFCDGAGLALLRYLSMGLMTPKATVTVLGLEPELEQLFRGFTLADYKALRPSQT